MTDIEIIDHAAQPTAVMREIVPMQALTDFFGRAFAGVMAALERQGVHPTGPPFALYHGKPTDAGVDVEAGLPVAGGVAATDGVTPSLHIDYKHTAIKQYHNCDARSHAMSEYVGLEVQPMLKT